MQPPIPELILGTAQIGGPYGIANRTGMPSRREASALFDRAWDLGIRWLDTARSYGVSEARIGEHRRSRPAGRHFRIATKLSATLVPPDGRATGIGRRLIHSWAATRAALGRHRLDILMVHRARHLTQPAVRAFLETLRDHGLVGRVGVSVQTVAELKAALTDPMVGQVQIPFNLLDDRWLSSDIQRAQARRPDIVIHARSLFLQGLLLLPDTDRWPAIPRVDPAQMAVRLDRAVIDTGRADRLDLCLAYARAQTWISGLVIGAETPDQLAGIADRFCRPPLDAEQVAVVRRRFGGLPTALLNPAMWPRYKPQATPKASTTRATSPSDRPT